MGKIFKNFLKKNRYLFVGILFLIFLFVVLEIYLKIFNVENYVFPSISEVLSTLVKLLGKKYFYVRLSNTLGRIIICLTLSIIIGVVLGLIGGLNPYFNACITPIMVIFKSIPVLAITLILLLNFSSQSTPVIIGFMMGTPIIYSSTTFGIKSIDKDLSEMLKLYKIPFYKKLFKVYVPLSSPSIFNGIETCGGLCIKAVISAEILCLTVDSIGRAMQNASANMFTDTPILFAYCLVAIILSLSFEMIIKVITKLLVKWK